MSLSLITSGPNSYDLYSNSMSCNLLTSTTIDCGSINSTEVALSSLVINTVNGDEIAPLTNAGNPVTMTLKYNYTGVTTLFYDSETATGTAPTDTKNLQLYNGASPNITGLPEIRGNVGRAYNSTIYMIITGQQVQVRLVLTKVSATEITIEIFPLEETALSNVVVGLIPFTSIYPVGS
jgi:hypothetical protein